MSGHSRRMQIAAALLRMSSPSPYPSSVRPTARTTTPMSAANAPSSSSDWVALGERRPGQPPGDDDRRRDDHGDRHLHDRLRQQRAHPIGQGGERRADRAVAELVGDRQAGHDGEQHRRHDRQPGDEAGEVATIGRVLAEDRREHGDHEREGDGSGGEDPRHADRRDLDPLAADGVDHGPLACGGKAAGTNRTGAGAARGRPDRSGTPARPPSPSGRRPRARPAAATARAARRRAAPPSRRRARWPCRGCRCRRDQPGRTSRRRAGAARRTGRASACGHAPTAWRSDRGTGRRDPAR